MQEIKTCKIHCLSTVLSPLTHMQGVQGNEAIINRSRVVSAGQVYDVPVLSGNAIRHRMVRDPGALFVIKACEVYGKLNIDQANYLMYGGTLSESQIADNLKRIADMQELLPLYRLLGGSLKNQVVSGSLLVSMGTLVCDENREVLEKLLPEDIVYALPELRSCEDYVSNWQYTRGDARKKPELLASTDTEADKSNLMIYNGQNVVPGAVFYHSFILQNVNRLELGALYAAISDWQADGGTIGGASRIGHGQLDIMMYVQGNDFWGAPLDLPSLADEYREYTVDNADRIVAWLNDAFPAGGTRKPKKGGKGAKPAEVDFFAAVDGEPV